MKILRKILHEDIISFISENNIQQVKHQLNKKNQAKTNVCDIYRLGNCSSLVSNQPANPPEMSQDEESQK